MARLDARVLSLVRTSVILGSLGLPAIAQEADEPPAVARPRPRTRTFGQIRQVQAETEEQPTNAGGPEAPNRRVPREQVAPFRVQAPNPALWNFLKQWEKSAASIKKMGGDIIRITYDFTFGTEKHATGKFAYEAPDKGALHVTGGDVQKGAKGKFKRGMQLTLVPDKSEHWVCTGASLLEIDDAQKTYSEVVIPPQNRGAAIMDTPLPFLFGMKAEQAVRRYNMQLLKPPPDRTGEIWVKVQPRWQSDAANYREAKVILDEASYLPRFVQLINPSNMTETVYMFQKLKVNQALGEWRVLGRTDPFKPDLSRYQRVQNPRGAANPGAEPRRAAGRDDRPPRE